MKTEGMTIAKLEWAVSIMSKLLYAYIAYNHYQSNPQLSNEFTPQLYIFLFIGVTSVLIGVLISMSAFKTDRKITKIISQIFIRNPKEDDNKYLQMFTIGLGFLETAALFGLVGFLSLLNLVFIIIMFVLSLTGWVFSYPKDK